MKANTNQLSLKVKGVTAHLQSIMSRINQHYVESSEGCYYIINGSKVSADEMNAMYHIVELEKSGVYKGEGLDGRTNWIK